MNDQLRCGAEIGNPSLLEHRVAAQAVSPGTQWANLNMSAKELEERCDEIFLRFESMLTETETSAPDEETAPQESVVTESPSATALSHLPSPVNQFLHLVDSQISENVHENTLDAHEPGVRPTVSTSAAQSPEICDEFKENHPTTQEPSSHSNAADVTCLGKSTSQATHPPMCASAEAVTNEARHIMELQQQLSIAKRVTDEQHSMICNPDCLADPVSLPWSQTGHHPRPCVSTVSTTHKCCRHHSQD